jgi:uncharacterized SAM-binding protein YcdF (DUF218 family)
MMKQKTMKPGTLFRVLLGLLFGITFTFSVFMSFVINFQSTLPFIIVCGISSLLTVYWKGFCGLLTLVWAKRWGKILISMVALLLGVSAVIFTVISGIMIASATSPAPQNATLILLGCQVRGEAPSLMLANRMETALIWLIDNEDAVCVLSGGQGPGENITEAECMRRWLIARGIADDRLFLEEKSTSTWENIRFSEYIIGENGLSTNVVIATDGFHQLRAQAFAKREGLTVGAISATTQWWLLPFYWFRETVAIAVQLT